MIKILFLVPKFPPPTVGGLEKQAKLLMAEINKSQNFVVDCLSFKFNQKHKFKTIVDSGNIQRVGSHSNRLGFKTFNSMLYIGWFLLNARRYSVVHAHCITTVTLMCLIISNILRIPTVLKMPNVGDYGLPGIKRSWLGIFKLFIIKRSSCFVSMCQESTEELIRFDCKRSKIAGIPNGIDLSEKTNDSFRNNETVNFAFIGRLSQEKNLDYLLDAWSNLIQKHGKLANLDIIGEGCMKHQLALKINKLKLSNYVRMRGHIENVDQKLGEYDVVILPSFFEGNSNVILESMKAGCCILASRISGNKLQFGPTAHDLLFEGSNADELAYLCMDLINNRETLIEFKKYFRTRCSRMFNIKLNAERYSCLYQELSLNNGILNTSHYYLDDYTC